MSRATVSKRVNDIPGFKWKSRRDFVEALFDGRAGTKTNDSFERDASVEAYSVEELADRVAAIETQLDEQTTSSGSARLEPESLHKVIHACMDAEYVSRDEELQAICKLLAGADGIDR